MNARVNQLLIALRDTLQPDKSTKKDKEYYKRIKKLKYDQIKDNWACEAVEGVPNEEFEKYLDELQQRYSLSDKVKYSFMDAMNSNEKHGGPSEFNLSENSEITMFSLEYTITRKSTKIDLAFATYNLYFKLHNEGETPDNKKVFSMSEGMKNAFRKLYQLKLYNYVDEKCISRKK